MLCFPFFVFCLPTPAAPAAGNPKICPQGAYRPPRELPYAHLARYLPCTSGGARYAAWEDFAFSFMLIVALLRRAFPLARPGRAGAPRTPHSRDSGSAGSAFLFFSNRGSGGEMLFFFLITDHFPDYFPNLGTDRFPDYLAGFGGRRLGSCGTQGVASLRGLRRSGSCDFASQSSSLRSSANLTPSAQANHATQRCRAQ